MTHVLPVRSRDDVIFGGGANKKKKDPPLMPEIQTAINDLEGTTPSADDYKMIGNMCYSSDIFSTAIKYYTKAVELDPENGIHYSNRSAAYVNSILLAGPSMAIKDADHVIRLKPEWFKGYLRKGDALFMQDKLDAAIEAYNRAILLNPDCSTAISSKGECMKRKLMKSGEIPPEQAPYSSETHRQDFSRAEPAKRTTDHPTPEDTEKLIGTWGRDTNMDNNATATKKYKGSLSEADRELGKNVKGKMMSNFRDKLNSDETLKKKVMDSIESDKLKGAGYDYREAEKRTNKELSKGTNEVGHAISAESYLSYKYESKMW